MYRGVLVILFVLQCLISTAQTPKKVAVSNSGCSIYTYCPTKFDFDYSEDSSGVYTGECINAEVTYGIICIKLLKPINDLAAAEEIMISYLDFLKADFHVKTSTGYGKGLMLNNDPNTRGVIDYWKDTELQNWKIKGWTDGKFIGVLYAYSKKELPEAKVNVFLDGFRLPVATKGKTGR